MPISTQKSTGFLEKNKEHKNIYAFSLANPHGDSFLYEMLRPDQGLSYVTLSPSEKKTPTNTNL